MSGSDGRNLSLFSAEETDEQSTEILTIEGAATFALPAAATWASSVLLDWRFLVAVVSAAQLVGMNDFRAVLIHLWRQAKIYWEECGLIPTVPALTLLVLCFGGMLGVFGLMILLFVFLVLYISTRQNESRLRGESRTSPLIFSVMNRRHRTRDTNFATRLRGPFEFVQGLGSLLTHGLTTSPSENIRQLLTDMGFTSVTAVQDSRSAVRNFTGEPRREMEQFGRIRFSQDTRDLTSIVRDPAYNQELADLLDLTRQRYSGAATLSSDIYSQSQDVPETVKTDSVSTNALAALNPDSIERQTSTETVKHSVSTDQSSESDNLPENLQQDSGEAVNQTSAETDEDSLSTDLNSQSDTLPADSKKDSAETVNQYSLSTDLNSPSNKIAMNIEQDSADSIKDSESTGLISPRDTLPADRPVAREPSADMGEFLEMGFRYTSEQNLTRPVEEDSKHNKALPVSQEFVRECHVETAPVSAAIDCERHDSAEEVAAVNTDRVELQTSTETVNEDSLSTDLNSQCDALPGDLQSSSETVNKDSESTELSSQHDTPPADRPVAREPSTDMREFVEMGFSYTSALNLERPVEGDYMHNKALAASQDMIRGWYAETAHIRATIGSEEHDSAETVNRDTMSTTVPPVNTDSVELQTFAETVNADSLSAGLNSSSDTVPSNIHKDSSEAVKRGSVTTDLILQCDTPAADLQRDSDEAVNQTSAETDEDLSTDLNSQRDTLPVDIKKDIAETVNTDFLSTDLNSPRDKIPADLEQDFADSIKDSESTDMISPRDTLPADRPVAREPSADMGEFLDMGFRYTSALNLARPVEGDYMHNKALAATQAMIRGWYAETAHIRATIGSEGHDSAEAVNRNTISTSVPPVEGSDSASTLPADIDKDTAETVNRGSLTTDLILKFDTPASDLLKDSETVEDSVSTVQNLQSGTLKAAIQDPAETIKDSVFTDQNSESEMPAALQHDSFETVNEDSVSTYQNSASCTLPADIQEGPAETIKDSVSSDQNSASDALPADVQHDSVETINEDSASTYHNSASVTLPADLQKDSETVEDYVSTDQNLQSGTLPSDLQHDSVETVNEDSASTYQNSASGTLPADLQKDFSDTDNEDSANAADNDNSED